MRFFLFSVLLSFLSCHNKPNPSAEEKATRNLLQQERKAHFDRNTDLFLSEFSDSMISVTKGEILKASVEQRRKKIEDYFNSVEFIKWDDMTEPQVCFSDDGSLAYAIVQKEVILGNKYDSSKHSTDTTNFAWVSIYKKEKGIWKLQCNISTNK